MPAATLFSGCRLAGTMRENVPRWPYGRPNQCIVLILELVVSVHGTVDYSNYPTALINVDLPESGTVSSDQLVS